ncbi:UDP-N-acetylglucosamine-N-acetylmuramylpentapeptide N-acetylglucosamine transferase [Dokdonia sp. Hel_I_63]|uniref:undecaprenyldiphospho-muramoylpentapeptide beta-N-acetylglucosaminyltransferase n=1 Tax=unclassified Dokdonia TaxID=2615033 RepID=UPI00020A78F2|nr:MULTISPECIES: undecaprenyldiphospho-muramoylpentapeptide beta-N-acetylglucosaminyltransferase [unclassified Dokdonia]AEE19874.1 UDP-N-acetylglucosamine--N-acetylmuramyl-(pentapeptide) pyrophosphoryl-undecaprenol N-acetylglucosamine transferase [Dokdonia sp. 4H-3-7-5]TVZ23908.1 UDP-N-acetylglucosamine-N-acetylmuramylpentapeptide N-acetylglucosamine transferase [Dokdonia sp. Hel_I_63]
MKPYRVILSGGGTGGHIYPAIAIAKEIQRRHPDAQFLFVGASDRMEMEKVPQAGFEIEGLWIAGIQRKLTVDNLMFPFKLISSLMKSRKIIKKFKPDVVIGTGGFASGPLLKMATIAGIPAVIQEQNSYAGITNKLLGKSVKKVCVAYDDMQRFFPSVHIVKTGNPVRADLLDIESKRSTAFAKYDLSHSSKVVLIIGGSLGAKAINELIEKQLPFFKRKGVQVLWQTGKLYYDKYKHHQADGVQVMAYIDQMDMAYAAADIIISRAGAGSVSELCIVGKATIFIPSPNVAEDHQTKNAQAIEKTGAAILIAEKDLDKKFELVFKGLLNDEKVCFELGRKIKTLALPNATADIVDEVEQLLK